jgi:drug/metabolite transporter (DMT)-like permease
VSRGERTRDSARAAEGYGLVLLAAACWAGGGLIAKWLFTMPGAGTADWPWQPLGIEIDPLLLSAARAATAFLFVLVYLLARRRDLLVVRARQIPFLVAFGVFGLALVHFTYFKTISLTGVATAILLEYLAPVIVLVFSVALLGERLTWALPAAVALSVLGCALMVGALGGDAVAVSTEGIGWGLASAVFFAGYALMGRYAAGRFAPWTLLAYGLGAATVFWTVVLGGPSRVIALLADGRALAAVVVMAVISTVIPFGAFLKALHLIEATKASVTSTVEPVIAGFAAWFLFAEHLGWLQLLGALLVVAAVILSQVRTRTPPEMPVLAPDSFGETPPDA